MPDVEKLSYEVAMLARSFTPAEMEVFETLLDYTETLPEGFFSDKTLEELNEHFGGHDDMVVTEKVRTALDKQQMVDLMMDAMMQIYDDLPEDDEDEDEE